MKLKLLAATLVSVLWAGLAQAAPFSITVVNGPHPSYPLLGAIHGYFFTNAPGVNLGPGSGNFAFFGGTTPTAPGAGPTFADNSYTYGTGIFREIESSIWSIDANNVLTPQWINTDLSTPTTYLGIAFGALMMTGDLTAFANTYGAYGTFTPIKLVYVPNGATGYIQGFNATTNASLGFLTPSWGGAGLYGAFTQDPNSPGRMIVSFNAAATPVPEPSSLALLALGITGLAAKRKTLRERTLRSR